MKRKANLLANLEDKIPKLRKIIDESRRLFEAIEAGDVRRFRLLIMNGANPFISDFDNRSLLSVAMDSDKKEFAAILCAGMIYRVLKKLPNYHDGFSSLKATHESGHTNLLLLKLLGIIQGFTLLENNERWKKELCASLYTCIDNEDIIMESLEFRAQRATLFAKGGGLYNHQNGSMR